MTFTREQLLLLKLSDQVEGNAPLHAGAPRRRPAVAGRPRIRITDEQRRRALEYFAVGLSCKRIAPLIGLSPAMLRRELPSIVRPWRPSRPPTNRPRRRHP